MALTITENFRMTAGGKAFRFMTITHDETTSTISAASLDLDYIEFVLHDLAYLSSTPADTSTLLEHLALSITGDNTTLEWPRTLPKAASISRLMVVGW